jgi:ribosome-associated translation inhibitor RaiA
MKIVFKNLSSSALIRNAIEERLSPILDKISYWRRGPVTITVERENSSTQAGPDYYTTTLMIGTGARGTIRFKEAAANLYHSIALLAGTTEFALRRSTERIKREPRRAQTKWMNQRNQSC